MFRVFAVALCVVLSPFAAAAADYQATTNAAVTIRSSPSERGEVLGRLPAGTAVSVEICFWEGEYCLINGPDVPEEGAFAAGGLLAIDGGKSTVLSAEQAKWLGYRENAKKLKKWQLSAVIRTEGDSYMAGAYGTKLSSIVAKVSGRRVVNTAVGGAEMAAIRDRILEKGNSALLGDVTVIWDGSNNGMTTVAEYADQLQQAIAALGHDRFIVIPPMHAGGGALDPVAAEFRRRWPDNFLDWRDVLGSYQGQIPTKYLAHPVADASQKADFVHLNDTAMTPMAEAIASFVVAKGW